MSSGACVCALHRVISHNALIPPKCLTTVHDMSGMPVLIADSIMIKNHANRVSVSRRFV